MRLPRAVSVDALPPPPRGRVGPPSALAGAAWKTSLRSPRPAFRSRQVLEPQLHPVEGVLNPAAAFEAAPPEHFLRAPNYLSGRFLVGEGRDILLTGIAKAPGAPGFGLLDEFNVSGGAGVPDALLSDHLGHGPDDALVIDESRVQRVPGLSVPFCHYGLSAFGHFVLDGLLQVHLWERELRAGEARLVHWLFPHPWLQAGLDQLRLPPRAQLRLQAPVALLQRAGLSSALAGHGVYFPGPFSGPFFDWLRVRFGARTPERPARLYVRRSAGFERGIANQPELEALLVQHGFTVYVPEADSLAGQIRTFAAAGEVVSPWGSTLTLAPLLAGPRRVIELLPDAVTDSWFHRQAVVHRLDYVPILHRAEPDRSFTADLRRIDAVLRALA